MACNIDTLRKFELRGFAYLPWSTNMDGKRPDSVLLAESDRDVVYVLQHWMAHMWSGRALGSTAGKEVA